MLEVTAAEYLHGHRIRIAFSNGQKGTVDLTEALWGPMFEPLRDVLAFQKFEVSPILHTIRWENDAMYREAIPHLFLHDVTVFTGLRGARRARWTDIALDATFGYRFNYLFQNGIPQPSGYPFRTVDVRNFTLSMALTPR